MKQVLIILFFLFVSIPVILPFFHTGYFPTHDGEWAVVRLGEMFRELRDMQIPPRYSENLNFGYGYPLFNFVYPSPYYLSTFIHFLGFGFVDSIKILFAASVPLSAFFMFLAAKSLWENTWAGLVSAVMYIYFPYRMVDLYVRGSIGESLSFVLFPLLFYLGIKLISKPSLLLVGGIGVFLASLIMTHNIMTVLFMPVYLSFVAILTIIKNKKAIKPFTAAIFLGFGLSAFFWIPALFEKGNILLSQTPIADRNLYFVELDQFLTPRWGYGVPIDTNGFSYQLGLVHLIVLVLTIFVFIFTIRHSGKYRSAGRLQMTVLLISVILFYIFLLFKPSEFLWKNIPLLSEINYPWIALGILGFLISLLAGFLSKEVLGRFVMIFLGIIAVFVVLPYAKPQQYINKGDSYYLTNDATTTSSNELMPLWVREKPTKRFIEKVAIVEGTGAVKNISYNSKKITFNVLAEENTKVRVNTIYYPGWKVYVDNKEVQISYGNEHGVMDIPIPSGKHLVRANFTETPLRLISNTISLLSFFVLLLLIVKRNKYEFS